MQVSERLRKASLLAKKRSPFLQVVKSAAATVAAWLAAFWLVPGQLPVFAAIAALLVVQPSVDESFGKAIERSIGVISGVLLATGISLLFGQDSWVILVAVVVAILAAWALRMTSGTANQVAISAMLVLTIGSAQPEYALDRVIETLIGAAIGIIVNTLIVPPVLVEPARRDVALLGGELAASLDRLAAALEGPRTSTELEQLMLEARLMRPMRDAAEASVEAGEASLTLNPRRSAHRTELESLGAIFERIGPVVTQVIGMTRAFADHYDDSIHREPTVRAIAEQLRRSAHDMRLLTRPIEPEPEPVTSEQPALTSALVVSPPTGGHWILIGSLMEDLRRIREELVD
ncbi:FUSC family protein [Agromyces archimandritae]|uniref:FUSC family protein n=1 Tax=Agromyces archimandritae TaxID=2781962 RepID=A0A975FP00_9MICO|nr:FUSC family protein [Agromyces archimandritae]QTX05695.1 FUSC family protein [Agromyces archimandritae]